jgi:hypothetical protein
MPGFTNVKITDVSFNSQSDKLEVFDISNNNLLIDISKNTYDTNQSIISDITNKARNNPTHIVSNWGSSIVTNEEILSPIHIDFSDLYLSTTSETISFSSSNTNDTSAGTGARTLLMVYSDETGLSIGQEIITLNGQTKVTSLNSAFRILYLEVLTAGSNGSNLGDIYAYKNTEVPVSGVPSTNIIKILPTGVNAVSMMTGFLSKNNRYWNFDYANIIFNSDAGVEISLKMYTRKITEGTAGLWVRRFYNPVDFSFQGAISIDLKDLVINSTTGSGSAYDWVITCEKTGASSEANLVYSLGYHSKSEYNTPD